MITTTSNSVRLIPKTKSKKSTPKDAFSLFCGNGVRIFSYFLFQIEYNTHTAINPTKPSAPKDLTTPVTLEITLTSGKNGMLFTPSSSKTINIAISDTATSAIDELHFLMLVNTSILLPPGI